MADCATSRHHRVDDHDGPEYAVIANLLWLLFRCLRVPNYKIIRDTNTTPSELNQEWSGYGREATWT
jgi:hypothetical protein